MTCPPLPPRRRQTHMLWLLYTSDNASSTSAGQSSSARKVHG